MALKSSVSVDPTAELIEVICSCRLSDPAKCPRSKPIMQGDGHRSYLFSFRMAVFQNRVAAGNPDLIEISDVYQDFADIVTRKITRYHS